MSPISGTGVPGAPSGTEGQRRPDAGRPVDEGTSISGQGNATLRSLVNHGPKADAGRPRSASLPGKKSEALRSLVNHGPKADAGGPSTPARTEGSAGEGRQDPVTASRTDDALLPLTQDGLIDAERARRIFADGTKGSTAELREYVLRELNAYFTGSGSGATDIRSKKLTKEGVEVRLQAKIEELLKQGERVFLIKAMAGKALGMLDGIVKSASIPDDRKETVARLVAKDLGDEAFIRKLFDYLINVNDDQRQVFLAESVADLVKTTNERVAAMTTPHFTAPESKTSLSPGKLTAGAVAPGVICTQGNNTCFIMSVVNALMTTEAGRDRLKSTLVTDDGGKDALLLDGKKVGMLGGQAGLSPFETTVSTYYRNTYHHGFKLGEQGFAEHVAGMFGLERPNDSSASAGLKGNEQVRPEDRLDVMIKVDDAIKAGRVPVLFKGTRRDTDSNGHYVAVVGTYYEGPGKFGLVVNDSSDGTRKQLDLASLSLRRNEVCEVQFFEMGLPLAGGAEQGKAASFAPSLDAGAPMPGQVNGTLKAFVNGSKAEGVPSKEDAGPSPDAGVPMPGQVNGKPEDSVNGSKAEEVPSKEDASEDGGIVSEDDAGKGTDESDGTVGEAGADARSMAEVLSGIESEIEDAKKAIEAKAEDIGRNPGDANLQKEMNELQTRMNKLFARWSDAKSGVAREFFGKLIDTESKRHASGKGLREAYGEIRDAIVGDRTLTEQDRSGLLKRLGGALRDGIVGKYGPTVASDHRLESLCRGMEASGDVSDKAITELLDRAEAVQKYVAKVDSIVENPYRYWFIENDSGIIESFITTPKNDPLVKDGYTVRMREQWDSDTIDCFRYAATEVLRGGDMTLSELNKAIYRLAVTLDGMSDAGAVYEKLPPEQRRDFLQVVACYCGYGDNAISKFVLSKLGEMRKMQPEGPITPETFSGVAREFFEQWIVTELDSQASGKELPDACAEIRDRIVNDRTLTEQDRSGLLKRLGGALRDGIAGKYGPTVASDHRLESLCRGMTESGDVSDKAVKELLDRAEAVQAYVAGIDDVVKSHKKWDSDTIDRFRYAATEVLRGGDMTPSELNKVRDGLVDMIDKANSAGLVYAKVPAEQRRDFLQVVACYCNHGDSVLDQSFVLSRLDEMRRLQPSGPITPDTFFKACTGKVVPDGFGEAGLSVRQAGVVRGLRDMRRTTLSKRGISNGYFQSKVADGVLAAVRKGVPYETALAGAVDGFLASVREYENAVEAVVKDRSTQIFSERSYWSTDDAENFRYAMRGALDVNPMLIDAEPYELKKMIEGFSYAIDGMQGRGESSGYVYQRAEPGQRRDLLQVIACYCNIPGGSLGNVPANTLNQSFVLSKLDEMRRLQPDGPITPETFFKVCTKGKKTVVNEFMQLGSYRERQRLVDRYLNGAFDARLSKCGVSDLKTEPYELRRDAERVVESGAYGHGYDWAVDQTVGRVVAQNVLLRQTWDDGTVSNFCNTMIEVSREDITEQDASRTFGRFSDMINGRNGEGFVYAHVPAERRKDFLQVVACYCNMDKPMDQVLARNPRDPLHQALVLDRLDEMRRIQPKGPITLETFLKACLGTEKVPDKIGKADYRTRQGIIDAALDEAIMDRLWSEHGMQDEDSRVKVMKDACMLANLGVPYERALSLAVTRSMTGAEFDLRTGIDFDVKIDFPKETHTLKDGKIRLFGLGKDNDFMQMSGSDVRGIGRRTRITMHEGKETKVFRNDRTEDLRKVSAGLDGLCGTDEQRRVLTWMLTSSSPVQREAKRLIDRCGAIGGYEWPIPFDIDIRRDGDDLVVRFDLPKGFAAVHGRNSSVYDKDAFSGRLGLGLGGSFRIHDDGTCETLGFDCRLVPDGGAMEAIKAEYREELDGIRRGKDGDAVVKRLMERLEERARYIDFRGNLDPEMFEGMVKDVRNEIAAEETVARLDDIF